MCQDDSNIKSTNTTGGDTTNGIRQRLPYDDDNDDDNNNNNVGHSNGIITDPLSISISKPFTSSSSSLLSSSQTNRTDQDNGTLSTHDTSSSSSSTLVKQPTTTLVLLRLLFCTIGICTCYICYGIYHERLLHDNNTKNHHHILLGPSFILFTQCITNVIVAMLWQQIQSIISSSSSSSTKQQGKLQVQQKSSKSSTTTTETTLPHTMLMITSICYVTAMICSNEAIPYVSYPVAVLIKSCKLIPTMVIGQVISYIVSSKLFLQILQQINSSSSKNDYQVYRQIAHTKHEWIAAICICIGIVTFHYQNPSFRNTTTNNTNNHTHLFGIYLLCTSLFMDGILSVCQNILKKSKHPPNAIQTMYYINLYAILSIGIFCIITKQFHWIWDILPNRSISWDNNDLTIQNLLFTFYTSIQPYISLIQNLCILNIAAAFGQIFIFITITWYTPVITTMITTTRKFITIVISVVLYGHTFTNIQWLCIMFIFLGLYIAIIGTTNKTKVKTNTSSSTTVMQQHDESKKNKLE
jgi:solute carrier family 35 (UDP-galactose transporter), member B1